MNDITIFNHLGNDIRVTPAGQSYFAGILGA